MALISSINARKSRRRVAASSVADEEPQAAAREAVEAMQGRGRGEWPCREGPAGCLRHGDSPGEGMTVDMLFVKGRRDILSSLTSENFVGFESLSAPLGGETAGVGRVGYGEEDMRGKGVGGGLDTGVTPAILIVDETRRTVRPLANN